MQGDDLDRRARRERYMRRLRTDIRALGHEGLIDQLGLEALIELHQSVLRRLMAAPSGR